MKINQKKTQAMSFDLSKTKDFIPQLSINGIDNIDVIYQTKLLGLVISSDLSWGEHIDYITKKFHAREILWSGWKVEGGEIKKKKKNK